MISRYKSYTANFKLKVIDHALEHGNRAAGRHFGVDEFCVRYWRRQQEQLKATNKSRKAFRGPKSGKYPQVEAALLEYIKSLRADECAVSIELLRNQARIIARKESIPARDFRASNGCATRFMRRSGLSLRKRTTLCQRLPSAYDDKVIEFHRFVIRIREQKNFLLSQIGNADQTPLNFDMPPSTTVEKKGVRSVHIRTTGAEKQRCTVMLAVTADGRKLSPFIIFKRKTLPKAKFPPGIHVRVQEKGWMTADLMVDWVKTVWGRRAGALLYPSLLVVDSFRGHLVDSVRAKLKELRTDLAVIPGGLTSMLQPLDVSLNKPFKDNVRRLYSEWMAEGDHAMTPGGKIKKPSVEILCSWVIEAWSMISPEIIVRSFKKTGISNALDGTEDDVVHENDEGDHAEAGNESDDAAMSDEDGSLDSGSE